MNIISKDFVDLKNTTRDVQDLFKKIFSKNDLSHYSQRSLLALQFIKAASRFIRYMANRNSTFLIVSSKEKINVAELSLNCPIFYFNSKWIKGTLTNWAETRQRLERLNFLEELLNKIKTKQIKRSKRIANQLQKEKKKLEKTYTGIRGLVEAPNVVINMDKEKSNNVLQECYRAGIPAISIYDEFCNPKQLLYPLIGLKNSPQSMQLALSILFPSL